jgi:hypothetical protein
LIFWPIILLFYSAAPINGLFMTIYQVQFHVAFPENAGIIFITLLIVQAILRFLNIFFFLINFYNGQPLKLWEKPEQIAGEVETARDIVDNVKEIAENAVNNA